VAGLGEDGALLLGLASLAALARPALKANRFGRREAKIAAAARHPGTDRRLKAIREARQGTPPPIWDPLDSWCRWGGYLGLAASYLLQLLL
jgi:hypothetical protein